MNYIEITRNLIKRFREHRHIAVIVRLPAEARVDLGSKPELFDCRISYWNEDYVQVETYPSFGHYMRSS